MSSTAQEILSQAIAAHQKRTYYSAYPENPKAYPETAQSEGLLAFQKMLSNDFTEIAENPHSKRVGGEVSPYMQTGLGITYPAYGVDELVQYAQQSMEAWENCSPKKRAEILVDSLQRISNRFFEIAYATMHTTGQSFVMSFQASGPHANDRALEVVSMALQELSRFDEKVKWVKPMGKFDLSLEKEFLPIPKGIGLVIGCSTFPTWNTVPGLYASLMGGNPVIVKPHPKAILPIAIVIAEIQHALKQAGLNPNIVQLAADTIEQPITKELAEHPQVKLIDYTGGSHFGDYIESLKGKTTFTEKAGVNSVILDSATDANAVFNNIAFSACLYSGQMCTAPQNIFISAEGVRLADGAVLSFEEAVNGITTAISALVDNPKAGPLTLGAIQNDFTAKRVEELSKELTLALPSKDVPNPEFPDARVKSPAVFITSAEKSADYSRECFGPALFIIKTSNKTESLQIAAQLASNLGAITCLCYTTDEAYKQEVKKTMNRSFTPVSFNFTGAAFVNQHAAFSDFHVSGGNPSGNAGFTNPEYVNKRWVWVGNRSL